MAQRHTHSVALLAGAATLTAAGLGLAYYASRLEPERLVVTRPPLEKRPPLRVVFFSDLHIGRTCPPRRLENVVRRINALKPDLVLFGGDFFAKFLRDAWALPFSELARQLRRIRAPKGKYAVLGNHDVREGARPFFEDLFAAGGFTVLWDEVVYPAPGVALCGLSPYSSGRALRAMPADGWRICLCHMPDKARYLPLKKADLMLSGHSHAGQVRLPAVTRLILPPGGKFYPFGLYRPQGPGAAQLYVSRGIGMSGVPFRFLAPPELVVLG